MSDDSKRNDGDRTRTVTWRDPEEVRSRAAGLSGLEIMRAIRDGTLPPPPMGRLMGFSCVSAEEGEVAMQLDYDSSLENSMGMLHGATAAAMLDTAMGASAHTTLPTGSSVVTLDLTLTYLRPILPGDTPIVATGRVMNTGRRVIYVTGELRDKANRLMAHAVGNFSVVGERRAPVGVGQ